MTSSVGAASAEAYAARANPRGMFTGSHMYNVKNARQRSENDVKLLQNRLERLRQEERKALKKIEETRRRADQIIQLKTRNQEVQVRKAQEEEYKERQQERARERLQSSKAGMSDAIRSNANALAAQKKQEAAILREQRVMIEEHLRQQHDQTIERNKQISSMIKDHAAEVQRQRMQQRMQHEETLQAEMENRMLEEEQRRNAANCVVSNLEQEEEDAIERLRRTQEAQRRAYEELERALINPPPPLDQRDAALGGILDSGLADECSEDD
mmetsp:Transcript_39631/g.92639  ORF Transcript_39631/g.92639 Transcript_39631/m.92639 type:complete len:270 (-) Transcript_39631:211-1020(-)|eukprot:CAMPEP_0119360496 /NCGR_PEP_ID=MMETSP1334-20130426/8078_1 /TAXON_ID=127549 /ORGANISM="Calcidiscus leptoporus, Strain RCC1130" /LENGTH=269 /DNA_ID=CAMNT_0007375341 /DNA_START=50 /DNA_END=859 /DNA_ORIENTATION=+